MNPSIYYGSTYTTYGGTYLTGWSNCTACNYNANQTSWSSSASSSMQYQCSACKAGSQLFRDMYGRFQCQETCDLATEFRSSPTALTCTTKYPAGRSCTGASLITGGRSMCQSGRCGQLYCCSEVGR